MISLSRPNAVRFDPAARRGHLESYFVKAVEPNGDRAIWIKATIWASATEPERPHTQGWAIAFDRRGGVNKHVVVKHVVPFSSTSFSNQDLDIHWTLAPPSGHG